MDIDEITVGQQVVAPGTDAGTVESIDYDDHMVWVRFAPVNGVPQLVDFDPLDLHSA